MHATTASSPLYPTPDTPLNSSQIITSTTFAPQAGITRLRPCLPRWLASRGQWRSSTWPISNYGTRRMTPVLPGPAIMSWRASNASLISVNQRRNDLTEQCDVLLLNFLSQQDLPAPGAELHSESPGLILDRLSILSLKLFHTREEVDRPEAPAGHSERNLQRLHILVEQRDDLADALDRLWQQVLNRQRGSSCIAN